MNLAVHHRGMFHLESLESLQELFSAVTLSMSYAPIGAVLALQTWIESCIRHNLIGHEPIIIIFCWFAL